MCSALVYTRGIKVGGANVSGERTEHTKETALVNKDESQLWGGRMLA